ncbi:phosphoglycerate kinase, partial [Candidatus Saccharibacteria bacterium]|nr:phosphoglycerate kinase [Candidatus Saccharibacteria bacterium]
SLEKVLDRPKKPLMLMLGGAKVDDKAPLIEAFEHKADQICVGGKIAADGAVKPANNIYIAEDFDEDAEGNKLDCGPVSTAKFVDFAKNSKTVIWNGLLGKAEDPAFATSSTIFLKTLGEDANIESIILGGDTTAFAEELMKDDGNLKFSLLSTGGGAALEFLSGNNLPGLEAIENK